jgi:3-oxoadipate enol-lactonase
MTPTRSRTRGHRPGTKVKVDGGELAFDVAGEGPPILFIHSAIADRRMWNHEFDRFSDDHQVVRFDLRGFGQSSAATKPFSCVDDLRAVLEHVHASPAFLVGSSMGGAFAIDFALAHPEMVRGLLLAAPGLSGGLSPPFDVEEQAAFEYDEKKSKEIAETWARKETARAFELLRALWCAALEGANLELFRTMVQENPAEVFEDRSFRHARPAPPPLGLLPSLGVPTTVLIGDRDNPSSVPFAQRIAQTIRGARLVTVPGADHLINLSQPDRFDTELRAALQRAG